MDKYVLVDKISEDEETDNILESIIQKIHLKMKKPIIHKKI